MGDLRTPTYDGSSIDFDSYQRDVMLWAMATPLRAEQGAPSLVLHLTGKAKQIAQNMDPLELNQDQGVEYYLEFLRSNLRLSNMHHAFDLFNQLISLKRGSTLGQNEQPILDVDVYVHEFYHLCQRLHQIGLKLPEAISTLMLINQAGLTSRERNLVQTILLSREEQALNFDRATSALKQILRPVDSGKHDAFLAETSDTESVFEEEIDQADFGSTYDAPCEVFFVRRNGKFFRRYPKRFRSHFNRPQYHSDWHSDTWYGSQYSGKSYPSTSSSKGYGKKGYTGYASPSSYPSPGKSKGKGKHKGSKGSGKGKSKRSHVYAVGPSTEKSIPIPDTQENWTESDDTWYNYEYDYEYENWNPENAYYCQYAPNWYDMDTHTDPCDSYDRPSISEPAATDPQLVVSSVDNLVVHSFGDDLSSFQILLADSATASTAIIH